MRNTVALLTVTILFLCLSPSGLAKDYQKVWLLPGHSEVLQVEGIEKVAVGNPDVIQAKLLDASHLLLNGVGIGSTNLLLMGDNSIQRILIEVTSWQLRQVQDYCKYVLGPDVKVVEINGQVFVSGLVSGEQDKYAQAITQRFPGVAVYLTTPKTRIDSTEVNAVIQQYFANESLVLKTLSSDIAVISGQAVSTEEYQRIEELIHILPIQVANLVKLPRSVEHSNLKTTNSLISLLSSVWPNLEFLVEGELVAIRGMLASEEFLSYQKIISEHDQSGMILSLVRPQPQETASLQDPKADQIRVRLHLLELNRQDLNELGFDWDNSIPFSAENSNDGLFQIGSFVRDGDLVSRLRLLSSKGRVRILAEPELTTVAGQEAKIHVGGEIPVSNGEGIEWKEYGIRFTITPNLDSNHVQMQVQAEVSSLDWTNLIELGDTVLPAISCSSFSTMLSQPPGSSTALGGILERRVGRTQNGLPGFSSLPLLGELFSWEKTETTERELVAIVSAHLAGDHPMSSQEEKGDNNSVQNGGAQPIDDIGL